MSVLSGGGGDDRLQVGMGVFALTITLVISLLVPMVAPTYDLDTGYTYQDIYLSKASIQAYTGESMLNMTPWALTGVYTNWAPGDEVNTDPDTGWIYGESVNYSKAGYYGTTTIGSTSPIYLEKEQKSDSRLSYTTASVPIIEGEWWAYGTNGDLNLFGQIAASLGLGTTHTSMQDRTYWNFTGYRYQFDPLLKIDYDDPNADNYSKISQSDASLSIVWYKDGTGQGLSNGLVLYKNTSDGMVSNLSISEIVANYDQASGYSTKYQLDFSGVYVYLNIKFDLDVINSGADLTQAFDEGRWSLAVTAKSMDNFMDVSASNSLSNSAANIIDTYIQIFTLSIPNVPFHWSIVLWLVVILPAELTVLMFLSRFGVVGVGIGILATTLLGVFAGGV